MKTPTHKSLKKVIRSVLNACSGSSTLLGMWHHSTQHRLARKTCDLERIFQHHFETNAWGSDESVSGPGSTLEYTQNIRKEIPVLLQNLSVKKILDAPCGDCNWIKTIQWGGVANYIGGDVVKQLVERNRSLYENPNTKFLAIDIINHSLPVADLWLCRDCLFHLSNHDIFMAIDNFIRSDIRYLLTSNHSDCTENLDIPTGSFRLLNLQLPPFNLCKPIAMIDDWIEGYPVRHLALWDRNSIKHSMTCNDSFQRALLK